MQEERLAVHHVEAAGEREEEEGPRSRGEERPGLGERSSSWTAAGTESADFAVGAGAVVDAQGAERLGRATKQHIEGAAVLASPEDSEAVDEALATLWSQRAPREGE